MFFDDRAWCDSPSFCFFWHLQGICQATHRTRDVWPDVMPTRCSSDPKRNAAMTFLPSPSMHRKDVDSLRRQVERGRRIHWKLTTRTDHEPARPIRRSSSRGTWNRFSHIDQRMRCRSCWHHVHVGRKALFVAPLDQWHRHGWQ